MSLAAYTDTRLSRRSAEQLVQMMEDPATPSYGGADLPKGRLKGSGKEPYRHARPRIGRNKRCPCGSGRKFKLCHLVLEQGFVPVYKQPKSAPVAQEYA